MSAARWTSRIKLPSLRQVSRTAPGAACHRAKGKEGLRSHPADLQIRFLRCGWDTMGSAEQEGSEPWMRL